MDELLDRWLAPGIPDTSCAPRVSISSCEMKLAVNLTTFSIASFAGLMYRPSTQDLAEESYEEANCHP